MKKSSSAQQTKALPQPHQLLLETHSKWSLHYLTGHKLQWFVPFVAKPVLYLAILHIAVTLVGKLPGLTHVYNEVFEPIAFLIEVGVFVWLGSHVMQQTRTKSLPRGMNAMTALVAGGLAGIFLGIILALFRIFWYQADWTFLNIFIEPPFKALEGAIITLISGVISRGIFKQNK